MTSLRPAARPGPKRVGPKSTKNPRSITFHAAHRARGRDAGTLAPPRIPPRTTHRTLLHLNMTQQPSGWGQPLGRNAGANCWCRATARRGPAPPACPTRVPRGARGLSSGGSSGGAVHTHHGPYGTPQDRRQIDDHEPWVLIGFWGVPHGR